MGDPLRRRRKVAPRHALPAATPVRRPGGDHTVLTLIIVLILTTGFVAGTTATFTSSTRNAGNSFIVGGISSPTNPAASMSNTTATFSYTNDLSGEEYNNGIGYRIMRKYVGGPSILGVGPGCASGSYDYIQDGSDTDYFEQYTQSLSYADATIPSAAADQGKYYCYAAVGVYPCCPANGNTPVITSLEGIAQTSVQTGYVVSSWSFNSGNNNQTLANGEKLIINFNQPVDVSPTTDAITAAENVCVEWSNGRVYLGTTATTVDTCNGYETQQIAVVASGGTWQVNYAGDPSTNISYNASAADVETILRASITAMGGTTNIRVTCQSGPCGSGTGVQTRTYRLHFGGTLTGNVNQVTAPESLSGSGNGTTVSTSGAGAAAETITFGYLSNATAFTGGSSRWDISAVAWSNSNKTATITLGNQLGTTTVTNTVIPAGTWTINPNPTSPTTKMRSAAGALQLCRTDPAGSPGSGLCRPQASAGW